MAMRYHYGNPESSTNIGELISLYPRDEFASPTRSTIPLLDLLTHSPKVFERIISELGFPKHSELYLEYKVKPKEGRGKASQTDAMLISDQHSMAIEVKWTEPMYQTVSKWLKSEAKDDWLQNEANDDNRTMVLKGWLKMIKPPISLEELPGKDFLEVAYQMVHRAASAAHAGDLPKMTYLLFNEPKQAAKTESVLKMLRKFWNLLGCPSTFPFFVVQIEMQAQAAYEPLRGLKKNSNETSEAICAALQDKLPLFNFEVKRVEKV